MSSNETFKATTKKREKSSYSKAVALVTLPYRCPRNPLDQGVTAFRRKCDHGDRKELRDNILRQGGTKLTSGTSSRFYYAIWMQFSGL